MRRMEIVLEPGRNLVDAVAKPLEAAGITAAGVVLSGVRLEPAKYVIPAFSPTPDHVAYYSATFLPQGPMVIEYANLTFGRKDGKPFLHCHALWRDDTGRPGCGHLLPFDCIVAAPGRTVACGCAGVAMVSEFDAETNFNLFHPVETDGSAVAVATGPGVVARIRPNQDLITSIEDICSRHGIADAVVHSCIGSLNGVKFDDGRQVDVCPTEILVLDGRVAGGRAGMEIALVDVRGNIHKGRPARGRNPILICCELVVQASTPLSA
jgi:predicted DNA-binding protein with PD1-like motif